MSGARASVSVDFFADLSCPWCYVGWASLKQAGARVRDRVAISLSWRPFLLAPDMAVEGVAKAEYFAGRMSDEKLAAANAALAHAAAKAETPLNLGAADRIPNTIDAHRLVHWAGEQGVAGQTIDALYATHFVDGANLGDRDVVLGVANEVGMDPGEIGEWLSSDKDRALMLELHAAAVQLGVRAVPVAVFNRSKAVMGGQDSEAYESALLDFAS